MTEKDTDVLIRTAHRFFDEGRFRQALKSYREILRTHRRMLPGVRFSLVNRIIECLYKSEQYSKALEELERVDRLFRAGSFPYAKLQTLKAEIYVDQGDYDKAIQSGEAAFEILRNADETEAILRVQRALGLAHFSKGNLVRAKICFEDVLSTSRRKEETEGMLISFNGLAQVCFFAGRWDQALEYWEQGLQVSRDSARKRWVASFSLNLGMIYRKLGKWSLALRYLQSGVKTSRALGHTLGVIRGRISLAFLYRLQRQWGGAIQLLETCRELCEKEGYRRELYLCWEGLGEIAFDREDYTTARQHYDKAYQIAVETAPEGDMAVEIHRRLADLSVALKNPKEALKYGESALRISKNLGDRFEEACTHRAFALAYAILGKSKKASQSFAQAIRLLEDLDERYDRARTLLELGRFLGRIGKGDEGIDYLLKARDLFEDLPSKYWMGIADLETAKVRLRKGGTDLAIISLDRAHRLLEATSENEALRQCSKLRTLIEKAMVKISLRASHHSIPDDNPDNLLKFLVKKAAASRAFAVLTEDGDFKMKAAYNIEEDKARRLLELLSAKSLRTPIISTNLQFSKQLSSVERQGVRSFVLVPFGPDGEGGVLYLDRKGPLNQKDLTLSVRLADVLALKIAQIRHDELRMENLSLRKELAKRGYPEIITRDEKMFDILNLVDKVKDYSTPVLIEGETGTGKELIARAIHYKGLRSAKPFVPLDCGALPDTLAENELFGHKKGAFTDAKEDKPGLFELASGGTLFLDEVSNLSLRTQAKLLRVLEEGRTRRIGEAKLRNVNVRVIAASNRSLEVAIAGGEFREDFYHRLKVIEINLPPLRRRRKDIPLLIQHFIEQSSAQRKKKVKGITAQALDILRHYRWSGNVRQLKNEIERAVILTEGEWITPPVLSPTIKRIKPRKNMESYNIQEIVKVLSENNWVRRKAARALGIPESTLRRRLKVHGVEIPANPE